MIKRDCKSIIALLTCSAALAAPVAHADAVRGRALYEQHCNLCHLSTAHVRANHKVENVQDLRHFVRRWSDYLKLGWAEEDRMDVEEYLHSAYYRFEGDPVLSDDPEPLAAEESSY